MKAVKIVRDIQRKRSGTVSFLIHFGGGRGFESTDVNVQEKDK